jgi:hypothetical protein
VIGEALTGYHGITTGVPTLTGEPGTQHGGPEGE